MGEHGGGARGEGLGAPSRPGPGYVGQRCRGTSAFLKVADASWGGRGQFVGRPGRGAQLRASGPRRREGRR